MRNRTWYLAGFLAILATACGRTGQPAQAPSGYGEAGAKSARSEAPMTAEQSGGAAYSAPSEAPAAAPGAALRNEEDESAYKEAPESRPGLATSWGEDRYSPVRSVQFERENGDSPSAVTMLYYNDTRGVRAMTHGEFIGYDDCHVSIAGGALTVSLEDADGRPLPAVHHSGRVYAVGEHGARYQIRIDNHTSNRVEAVATVDGLDVIDGDDGNFSKRGYLIDAYDSVSIDGFRRSEANVASFRFGSVSDSYAERRGKGRNVGVIGVAFFREQGSDWDWNEGEIRRRTTADPFPGHFAPPPPSRY